MIVTTERFCVEHVVGSGAMGTVFRATDTSTGLPCALKVLRTGGHAARFVREVGVLARLEHPRIVRYLGHGTTAQGEPFLAMEWLEGEDLRARLRRQGLTVAETLTVGIGVAAGLAAAHRAGVIHRDIKPTNLLIVDGQLENVKIVDFGVARASDAEGPITQSRDLVGSPAYMAPEQASDLRAVGPAADVYALGAILHECIGGRPPVISGTLTGGRPGAPLGLRALRPDVPAEVAQIVDRMVARNPAARPRDGAAAHAALDRVARAPDLDRLPPPATISRNRVPGVRLGTGETPPVLGELSARIVAVLGRHVPMPMAILRSQCERLARDPARLERADGPALFPALADAVARFTSPGTRAIVLADLDALFDLPERS